MPVSFSLLFCCTVPRQAHRILVSIYDMTQKVRCQRTGKQQPHLAKPLESMEQLIMHNCSPEYLVRGTDLWCDNDNNGVKADHWIKGNVLLHYTSGCMLSEEENLLFSCPENARKEENEDQVNQSYQGTDHMLAETSECLFALQVGHVLSSWFL